MTIDQFLGRLARTPREWRFRYDGEVRGPGGCCPISALARGGPLRAAYWNDAAAQLGLSRADMMAIILAADNDASCALPLRRRILAACGLEERCANRAG